jgi:hypothetical protein
MNPKSCKAGVCCAFDDKELLAGSIADDEPPTSQLFKWVEWSDSGLVFIDSTCEDELGGFFANSEVQEKSFLSSLSPTHQSRYANQAEARMWNLANLNRWIPCQILNCTCRG